jgi:ParB/RepB/Spo0J family partition protein
MDIQLPLISFDEAKAKLIKIEIAALPANELLISPTPSREFIQDIMDRGQLQPIHLNRVGHGKYYVIAGRRRIKAFRELAKIQPDEPRWKVINALVVDVSDEAAILGASAENNRRSINVLTDLQALDYLLSKNPSMTIPNLAKFSGMSQGTVKSRLKLKSLMPELLQGFIDGNMTSQTAEAASKLPSKFQSNCLVIYLKEGKLSLEDVVEAQRVHVQETIDTQLTLPDVQLDPLPVEPSLLGTSQVLPGVQPAPFPITGRLLGYSVYSNVAQSILTIVTEDRQQAQGELEFYQGQLADPSEVVLVTIHTA